MSAAPPSVPAQAAGRSGPPGKVRLPGRYSAHAAPSARGLGRLAPGTALSLALALPLRDPAGLHAFLGRLYDPRSPLHGRYLSPDEFTRRYGPTEADYRAVAAYARRRGLTVTGVHPNRLLLDVSGSVGAVEAAFGIHLMSYQGADGRRFHMPDAGPTIPAALAGKLEGVVGLDDSVLARPHLLRRPPTSFRLVSGPNPLSGPNSALAPAGIGSGPLGGLTPADIGAAYGLTGATLTGAGRTLALYELDGYAPGDIAQYENAFGLPQVPLQNVLVGQSDGSAGGGAGEVTLDIELMIALAPGASGILVYEGKNGTSDMVDVFNRIATDNTAKEVSTSWGIAEGQKDSATLTTENNIFQQMAAQGQSIYAAAGDSGAYDDGRKLSVDDPASQPFVTGVGGTRLTTAGPGGAYQSESAWGNPSETHRSPFGAGGGGGVSQVWSIPDYQASADTTANGGSGTARNVPDVALDADPNTGYAIYFNGGWTVFGGTSCAAPLWAAFTALVNQQRAAGGKSALGFPNPALYRAATGPNYGADFNDVADGSNNLAFVTGPGYDNATGWGSFNGTNLLDDLAGTTAAVPGTTTALASSQDPSVAGQSVTFTARVTAAGGNDTPTGSMQFAVDGAASGGPVTLDGSGAAADTEAGLTPGTHAVTATYTPAGAFGGSSGTLTQTVQAAPAGSLHYVSPSGSDGNDGSQASPKLTIQAAIDAAQSGDTVIVADGTYSGDGNRDLSLDGLDITVTSQNGAAKTVLDCGGSASADGSGNHRGFYVNSGETAAVISGFTIRNGYETYVSTITDSGTGGGICIHSSSVTVQNCVVTGCTVSSIGGGVYNDNGGSGTITLTGCTVTGNTALGSEGGGGGVFNNQTGTITMTGCTVTGNATGGVGGGVCNVAGAGLILLADCVVAGNTAPGGGGGVYNSNVGGTVLLTNCTLTGNDSQGVGSDGVYNGNYLAGGTITLTNDILYADAGVEAANDPTGTSDAVALHCDVQGGYPGAGDIDADPLFVSAATGDLHLKPGSPCLGAGTSVGAPGKDRDGKTRPNPPSIGAYEAAATVHTHLLWTSPDGRAVLWNGNPDGTFGDHGQYGPYTDAGGTWHAVALATGPDGVSHILWTSPDGRAVLWDVKPDGTHGDGGQFGPYTDAGGTWRATAVSVGPDALPHLLWSNPDGRSVLWDGRADGTYTNHGQHGPYTDAGGTWRATAVSVGPDDLPHLLWSNPDGRSVLWDGHADGRYTDHGQHGPYTDAGGTWRAVTACVGPDDLPHLLWTSPDGRAVLWNGNGDGTYSDHGQHGPYTDAGGTWHALTACVGPDALPHLLWTSPDGRAVLWNGNPDGTFSDHGQHGPYTDAGGTWHAVAASAGP